MTQDTAPVVGALKPQDELSRRIGAIFREHRERRGLSLSVLSAKMDRAKNVIRWHEAGTRLLRMDDLHRAAVAMGVAPSSLCLPHAETITIEQ